MYFIKGKADSGKDEALFLRLADRIPNICEVVLFVIGLSHKKQNSQLRSMLKSKIF